MTSEDKGISPHALSRIAHVVEVERRFNLFRELELRCEMQNLAKLGLGASDNAAGLDRVPKVPEEHYQISGAEDSPISNLPVEVRLTTNDLLNA